ncbi:MAG: flagellar biosynthesis anti-sigma factor FlgM [Deltaproteobacteria bacterium]|nr:flagellar biosynthesis anti-sigma factor FlgM [Deltaproteobacteria bacterium]
MKINDNANPYVDLVNYLKGVEAKKPDEAKGAPHEALQRTDSVSISKRSREAQGVREIIDAVPGVRNDRVEELKRAVSDNVYNVNGEAVAGAIIKSSIIDTLL